MTSPTASTPAASTPAAASSAAPAAAAAPTSPQPGGDEPRRRLGRGLNALLGGSGPADGKPAAAPTSTEEALAQNAGEMRHVAIGQVEANPHQARRDFNADDLADLTGSVREHGVLQPLLVREIDGGFQLVAGERRLKAARKAGLETVPVRVVDVIDQTAYEYALEENLKRSDLNVLEKARAFRAYLDLYQSTAEDLAKQLSMSAPAMSNTLRLLDLPEPAQKALSEGRISAGHARAVLMVKGDADRMELCGRIQAEGLSVRQAETEARGMKEARAAGEAPATLKMDGSDAAGKKPKRGEQFLTPHVKAMETKIRDRMGVKTEIRLTAKEKGRVVLTFATSEEFEQLTALLCSVTGSPSNARKAA